MNLESYKLFKEIEKLIKKNDELDKEIEVLVKEIINKEINKNLINISGTNNLN